MKMKTKLKIAVCFFGHLRTYEKCAPFLRQHLLDKYDCDLFMHTWATLDHNTKTWHDYKKVDGFTQESDIVRAYGKFKGLAIEEQKPLDMGIVKTQPCHHFELCEVGIFGIGAQFHSIRESNRLCEEYAAKNKINYDFIVCVRPDILLKKPMNIEEILESLSEQDRASGFFTITGYYAKLIRGFESLVASDVLFFGSEKVIRDAVKNTVHHTDRFKPDTLIYQGAELEFIKLIQERGWVPYRMDFRRGVDWDILRHDKSRRKLIRMRIRKNYIHIYLLQAYLRQLCRLNFSVLDWNFDLRIGGNTMNET